LAHQKPGEPRNLRTSVKGPLMFSAFWAVLAFFAVLIFASGGSARSPRFDLAFTGAGIAFIVTLVIAAMLSMSHKDNSEHLGKGSGVNLSSKKSSGHGGYSVRSETPHAENRGGETPHGESQGSENQGAAAPDSTPGNDPR
jgi:hypothetical protein